MVNYNTIIQIYSNYNKQLEKSTSELFMDAGNLTFDSEKEIKLYFNAMFTKHTASDAVFF